MYINKTLTSLWRDEEALGKANHTDSDVHSIFLFATVRPCHRVINFLPRNVALALVLVVSTSRLYAPDKHHKNTLLTLRSNCRMPPSNEAVAQVGARIAQSIGHGHVNDLRVHPNSKKYLVPSATHAYLEYVVHLTESDKRNACTCEAHKRRITRPCKHVLALKAVLGL